MTFVRTDEADAEYLARVAHRVDEPERYGDWRTYAFSNAPELASDSAAPATPVGGIPTV
jgi:hypothetical protein